MAIRISLDSNILADTPRGWDEAVIKSKRGSELKGLFLTYSSDLEFYGDGFDYLIAKMNDSYCNTVEVLIETNDCDESVWIEEFNGVIQLTQITSYDVDKKIIKTKIFDDTFDAKINNNKSLKAFVDVATSKNDISIQAVTPVDIELFLPTAGTAFNAYLGTTREGVRVYDAFRFIIDYITDGEVTFKSDLFSGEFYDWMLFNGKEMRVGNGGGDPVEVSFKEIYSELNKKCNLSFAIEPTPTGYVDSFQLRLEKTEYFEQDDAILTLDNVAGILMDFNKSDLYSNIDIGSTSFDDDVVLSYPPLNFKAFKKENYTILGQCNVDKALNLVSKYIIDSNVIEDVLVNSEDKYDKKIFLIVTDGTKAIKYKEYSNPVDEGTTTSGAANKLHDTGATFITDGVAAGDMAVNMLDGLTANVDSVDSEIQLTLDTDIFASGDDYQIRADPFNYNDPLTNVRVIERFTGGLPNSVIKRLNSSSTANFRAGITTEVSATTTPFTIDPVVYDDDSTAPFFDDGGNFDAVTNYDYTIPNSGLYGFKATSLVRMNGSAGNTIAVNGGFTTATVGSGTNADAASWSWNYYNDQGIGNLGGNNFWFGKLNTGRFLKQAVTLNAYSAYLVTFNVASLDNGGAVMAVNQVYSSVVVGNTPQTISIVLNYSQTKAPPQYVNFVCDQNVRVAIDTVVIQEMARIDLRQKVIRSSNAGVTLQEFTTITRNVIPSNQFQIEVPHITDVSFSAFKDEKITVKIEGIIIAGKNNKAKLLTDRFNQDTQETEYSDFETVLVDDGGGDILPVDIDTFPVFRYKFNKGLKFSEFKLLKDAPEKAVLFSNSNVGHLFGWRNSISYDRKTGETKFELRSKTKID